MRFFTLLSKLGNVMHIEMIFKKQQKICQVVFAALEAEFYRIFLPICPDSPIRIREVAQMVFC